MKKSEYNSFQAKAIEGTLEDDKNPIFILSMTANELLIKIAAGTIDLKKLAEIELNNRGFDALGKWKGF